MEPDRSGDLVDALTLRFSGRPGETDVHELRAAHVADVLQGLVGLTSDFTKAGAFGDGPVDSEMLVRPPSQGSFVIEVLQYIQNHADTLEAGGVVGLPSLSTVIWWATRSARAQVSDFEYLENGNVKVVWQDDTTEEIPRAAWQELNKRRRRRKKQLRQIMAPFSDERVSSLELDSEPPVSDPAEEVPVVVLTRDDYQGVRPDDEIEETDRTFDVEAQMSAIDFDNPAKWRVKTVDDKRTATVEDREFLGRVAGGLPIRSTDIFQLRIREQDVLKNGKRTITWTVLSVDSHRQARG